jgi:hypothetical protein
MSYSPEPGRDPRPAPWASPSTTDPQDKQRFEEAGPAGSTRVDEAADVTPDREDRPAADRTQPVPAYAGGYPGDQPAGHPGGYPGDQAAGHPGGYTSGSPGAQPQPADPWGPPPPPVPQQRTERRGPRRRRPAVQPADDRHRREPPGLDLRLADDVRLLRRLVRHLVAG